MHEAFDPTIVPIVLMVWPATKSLVFTGAAAISLWSRKPARRAEARRIMRMISRTAADRDER
jgi:hypothetical protein